MSKCEVTLTETSDFVDVNVNYETIVREMDKLFEKCIEAIRELMNGDQIIEIEVDGISEDDFLEGMKNAIKEELEQIDWDKVLDN